MTIWRALILQRMHVSNSGGNAQVMRIMHVCRASEMLAKFMIPVMKAQLGQGHYVCACVSGCQDSCVGENGISSYQRIKNAGVDVYTHDLKRSANPFAVLKAILTTKKLLHENTIDTVVCHSVLGSIIGRLAGWLSGTSHRIYFCHGLACAPGQNRLTWLAKYGVERFMAIFTTGILVMNQYDHNLCESKGFVEREQLFMTSGMGVDLTQFDISDVAKVRNEVFESCGIRLDNKLVVCVSRLIPEKGVGYYIAAAAEICSKRDDVAFLLVGDGPLMPHLKRIVVAANLKEQIRLLGWCDNVAALLKAADIFVLPSYYPEGLSVAVLEAMAAGKPVITTNNRGCIDSIKSGETGMIVPMHSITELTKSIMCLLDDENLCGYLGRNARSFVEDNCSLTECTRKIIRCLDISMNSHDMSRR